ncbi:hypothetical protein C8F04DRAFT_1113017 [Mycena alexandri]|uniref:F-box domain-containing protein n=1 Tax=Mycena alexandri TaxID=1745969 RepID=A0AAD6SN23_9AGAR|nr:hypothetical protein C8F04DRAFT_1113017 [Mycena alexandri]
MNSQAALGFLDLTEDVILLILADYCDVKSVVRISETSKYLHTLAFLHDVWLSLVTKLVQRHIIDVRRGNENLQELSTDQLIAEVKRTLHGPETYNSPPNQSVLQKTVKRFKNLAKKLVPGPTVALLPSSSQIFVPEAQRIVIRPHIEAGPLSWERRVMLLPGGEYVLFQTSGRLECWRISQNTLIWTHICAMRDASVRHFAADLIEDDRVVILTCQNTWDEPQHFIEITILDLKSGNSNLVLVSRAPVFYFNGCAVCGNIAAVDLTREVLIIDWSTHSHVVVKHSRSGPPFSYQMVLIPHYIILPRRSYLGEHLTVCPIAAFEALWVPVDSINEPSNYTSLDDLPTIPANDVPLEAHIGNIVDLATIRFWVYESPIACRVFRVWAHTSTSRSRVQLCAYKLTIQHSGVSWERVSWDRLRFTSTPRPGYPLGMLYSGHFVNDSRDILPPVGVGGDTADIITLDLPWSGSHPHVSPEGGFNIIFYD